MSVLSAVLCLLCTVGNVVKLVRSRKKKGTRRESMRVTLNESSKSDRKGGKRGLTVDGRSRGATKSNHTTLSHDMEFTTN